MKKIVLLLVALLPLSAIAQSDSSNIKSPVTIRLICHSTVDTSTAVLYLVNGTVVKHVDYIHPNGIDSVKILKDASATAIYGVKAINGVVSLKLKKEIKLLNISEMLDHYKINKKYRHLPVFVELKRLTDYANFYATTDKIAKVEVCFLKDKSVTPDSFIKVWLNP